MSRRCSAVSGPTPAACRESAGAVVLAVIAHPLTIMVAAAALSRSTDLVLVARVFMGCSSCLGLLAASGTTGVIGPAGRDQRRLRTATRVGVPRNDRPRRAGLAGRKRRRRAVCVARLRW